MKRQPEQTFLAAATHQGRDVQERRGKNRPTTEDPDFSRLLHNEDPATAVPGIRDGDWRCETGGDRLDLNRGERAVLTITRIVKSSNRWIA